jgi:hypothetical protein
MQSLTKELRLMRGQTRLGYALSDAISERRTTARKTEG